MLQFLSFLCVIAFGFFVLAVICTLIDFEWQRVRASKRRQLVWLILFLSFVAFVFFVFPRPFPDERGVLIARYVSNKNRADVDFDNRRYTRAYDGYDMACIQLDRLVEFEQALPTRNNELIEDWLSELATAKTKRELALTGVRLKMIGELKPSKHKPALSHE